jgi:hypothetical protein
MVVAAEQTQMLGEHNVQLVCITEGLGSIAVVQLLAGSAARMPRISAAVADALHCLSLGFEQVVGCSGQWCFLRCSTACMQLTFMLHSMQGCQLYRVATCGLLRHNCTAVVLHFTGRTTSAAA